VEWLTLLLVFVILMAGMRPKAPSVLHDPAGYERQPGGIMGLAILFRIVIPTRGYH
jgi:hypothetical protein